MARSFQNDTPIPPDAIHLNVVSGPTAAARNGGLAEKLVQLPR